MTHRIRLLSALALPFLVACATIHNGKVGEVTNGDTIEGLNVSATEVKSSADEPFLLFTVTLENKSDKWIRVTSVETPMSDDVASKVSLVVGNDLIDWSKAQAAKRELEDYNDKLSQIALAVAGASMTIGSSQKGNTTAGVAGTAMLASAAAWESGSAFQKAKARAQNANINGNWVPADHLYSPFAIPGKGFVRKWILYNVPVGLRFTELPITISTADGRTSTINLKVGRHAH